MEVQKLYRGESVRNCIKNNHTEIRLQANYYQHDNANY